MSHPVASAVILAGGLGTRLRTAVPDLPKPMAPINGRPFLEHQIDYWIDQGIRHFVLSVGYRRELIMDHFGASYRNARIDYAVEHAPLGTGGGLLLAVKELANQKPFLLLNGDTFFEVRLDELAAFHARTGSDLTFSLFATHETGRYMGLDVAADGRILSLRSAAGQPIHLANGGVYLVAPQLLLRTQWQPGTRLSLEDDIMPALLEQGSMVCGLESRGRFIDIGVPDDYRRAATMLAA